MRRWAWFGQFKSILKFSLLQSWFSGKMGVSETILCSTVGSSSTSMSMGRSFSKGPRRCTLAQSFPFKMLYHVLYPLLLSAKHAHTHTDTQEDSLASCKLTSGRLNVPNTCKNMKGHSGRCYPTQSECKYASAFTDMMGISTDIRICIYIYQMSLKCHELPRKYS